MTANGIATAVPFYRRLLGALLDRGVPFLVGGAFGFAHFTGIHRPTKDIDLFIRKEHWSALAQTAQALGYRAELAFAHWLGKVHDDSGFADVIFNSGNGLSPVDDAWFEHASTAQLFGLPVQIVPIEECLWTKAFIMERERYDGADVAHLLHAGAPSMDWQRLLMRFGPHWRVLLSHLVLFGFIYPGQREQVPSALMDQLTERLRRETHAPPPATAQCAGTLLSRQQYLPDVTQRGCEDPRLPPHGSMQPSEVAAWTAAIDKPERMPSSTSPDAPV